MQVRLSSKRFDYLSKGMTIRIRSVKLQDLAQFGASGTIKQPIKLELQTTSNILEIPHYYKQANEISERFFDQDTMKKLVIAQDIEK